jgi:nitrite reductase/ring-hydroxylating ferredoxin subunit
MPDPGARNFVVKVGEAFFHGFAVRRGGVAFGYVDQCPHAGLPLARQLDSYLSTDHAYIACAWHGALFAIEDGRCVGGPCVGAALQSWLLSVEDGWLMTA